MIDLGLDFFPATARERSNINLIIKMADVANDGLIFHFCHVIVGDHIFISGGRYKNISLVGGVLHRDNTIAFHCSLQRADGIDFSDPDLC